MAKLIKNWNDLIGLESEQYRLEIDTDMGCGHIIPKDDPEGHRHYLSTHTFYGRTYKGYEELLQKCGFDIKLISWDADDLD